ncbi:hypothetical protein [Roseibium aquae]|uniref:hypothetical protein n=1 Tax=Roseibium aquae TaxID=1323746 RepID=UPI00123D5E2D|nr:hypothetical protein [Roseibium aquae]
MPRPKSLGAAGVDDNGWGHGPLGDNGAAAAPPKAPAGQAPDTSALNQKIVQAVSFANSQNAESRSDMVVTPPELMTGQAAGLAVQGAENYMTAVMQIAIAGQAVAAKKIAETDGAEGTKIMNDMNTMVTNAVQIFSTVSKDAGQAAKEDFQDFEAD